MQASRLSVSFVGHTAHCGTESEYLVLNGSHIFISLREYWCYLVLSPNIHVKEDEEGKPSAKDTMRQLVLTFCSSLLLQPTEKTETLHVCIFGEGIGGREKHTKTREIPRTRKATGVPRKQPRSQGFSPRRRKALGTRLPRKYLVHVNRHHWMTLTWYNNYSVASYDSRS